MAVRQLVTTAGGSNGDGAQRGTVTIPVLAPYGNYPELAAQHVVMTEKVLVCKTCKWCRRGCVLFLALIAQFPITRFYTFIALCLLDAPPAPPSKT